MTRINHPMVSFIWESPTPVHSTNTQTSHSLSHKQESLRGGGYSRIQHVGMHFAAFERWTRSRGSLL